MFYRYTVLFDTQRFLSPNLSSPKSTSQVPPQCHIFDMNRIPLVYLGCVNFPLPLKTRAQRYVTTGNSRQQLDLTVLLSSRRHDCGFDGTVHHISVSCSWHCPQSVVFLFNKSAADANRLVKVKDKRGSDRSSTWSLLLPTDVQLALSFFLFLFVVDMNELKEIMIKTEISKSPSI